MERFVMKPGTMVYPLPAALVTCGTTPEEYNIITIAWTGTTCSDPPQCYISVRPGRHSHPIISRYREFVINLTTEAIVRQTDWCGVKSGRDFDKFKETGLTPIKAQIVKAPLIKECPVNIECKVTEIKSLGVHDMFLADVVAVNADPRYMDEKTGAFNLDMAHPISYSNGFYYATGQPLGKFGFSIQKRKPRTKK